MPLFYVLAVIVVGLGLVSLRNGFKFARYVRSETARPLPTFTPFASVIAPCRGLDQGLRENIAGLFDQEYPSYEIIFVTDNPNDPALPVIEEAITMSNSVPARFVIAGEAVDSGQKVHNLRAAVSQVDPETEVLVFVDTDGRPQPNWLGSLVSQLADERIGATTGYRWFIAQAGGFAAHLRSVWNSSIASALGKDDDKNFCWGGSTAIRKHRFDELGIVERWRGTVSDDFTMTRVLQEANLPIRFVPACLVASLDGCTFRELFEFSNRQLKITRVYAAHLWMPVLLASVVFCAVFFGGVAMVIARALMGLTFALPLILLLIIYLLGAAKAFIRLRAVSVPLREYRKLLRNSMPAHLLLWPFASALYLFNALVSAFSRRIEWRGITYELKSPTEAVIIRKN